MTKRCKLCNGKIRIEDKATLLHTFLGKESIEKVYWHLECYDRWFNDNSSKRAEQILNNVVLQVIPKNLINNINNLDNGN